ncbi:unnamed protein product [Hydatigera taeniaeformis]|uniref:Uncharacterized protein n=1 Tax=Hydatigena taeniaeformis TaxID=6205 RepID=A0A3P7EPX3_HYDTA|nr:unnamed protein product [Hydatigera taeniaeformis]
MLPPLLSPQVKLRKVDADDDAAVVALVSTGGTAHKKEGKEMEKFVSTNTMATQHCGQEGDAFAFIPPFLPIPSVSTSSLSFLQPLFLLSPASPSFSILTPLFPLLVFFLLSSSTDSLSNIRHIAEPTRILLRLLPLRLQGTPMKGNDGIEQHINNPIALHDHPCTTWFLIFYI